MKSKRFYQFKQAVDFGCGLALENVWAVVNWFKEALSRKMEPENLLPYMEMARFHSSKGGLPARGTEHPTQTLFSLKPLGTTTPPPVELWNQVSIHPLPPSPIWGCCLQRTRNKSALNFFSFTCCLPLDIKSFVNKIPFLGTSSGKRGCYFSYPLSSFCQIEMRPLSRGKTTHVLHLSRVS